MNPLEAPFHLAASFVALAFAGAATAQDVELKFADQFPLTHIASTKGAQAFSAEIDRLSDGRIAIQHFPAQQLAKAAGMLDAVTRGVAEITNVVVAYHSDQLPLTSVVELPGFYETSAAGYEAINELIDARLMEEEFAPKDIRPLWAAVYPSYQIMTTSPDKITDISQLEGQKYRAAGSATELMVKAIGAVPVNITPPDMYVAVSRGVVDGILYNLPSVFGYKLEELLKSATTNAGLGSVVSIAFISEDAWRELSPEDQDIIMQAAETVGEEAAAAIDASADEAAQKMADQGITVYELPQNVLDAFAPALESVQESWVEQVGARGLPAEKTLADFAAAAESQ